MPETQDDQDANGVLNTTRKDWMYEHLTVLFEYAGKKVSSLDEQRAKNLNFALVIFAGATGLNFKLQGQPEAQTAVSVSALLLMLLYDCLDGRYRMRALKWSQRRRNFSVNKLRLIREESIDANQLDSDHDVDVGSVWTQLVDPQQLVCHVLVLGALLGLFWSIWRLILPIAG